MLKIPFTIPTYEIRRASPAPAMDGWLDSPCWRGATWIDKFIAVETDKATGKPTSAALLWDDRYLYVGVKCVEPRLALIKAAATTDRETWNDDSVEVYLDPAIPGVESVDTAINVVARACPALRIISDPGWGTYQFKEQDGIKVATRLTGTGWQVEAAIPFGKNRLPRPKAGQKWRGNICRNDKLGFQWSYWALGTTPGYVYSDNKLFPYLLFSSTVSHAQPSRLPTASWPRKPRFELRGMMYDTSRGSIIYTPDYWVRLMPFLRDMGYNSILMYFENHLRYPSHPEFAPPGSWTLEELAATQKAAARYGIDIIPAQTSIGHCPGILTSPKYKHLAEAGSNSYQFCVSHPETPGMLADIFSELCQTSRSPYVSINADESAYLGLCPRCRREFRGWTPGKIFRHHILRLYDVVKSNGKRMMMWDDMLWSYPDAVKGLPRDIILLDWHYCLHRRYPSVDVWRREGFDVVVCPGMYLVENAFWLADYGAARGSMGLINTLWEDHSLSLGSRWHQFLATSWAGCAKAPVDMEDWYVRAGTEFFGNAGARLGRSLAAQDQLARNAYRFDAPPSLLDLAAGRQVITEAEQLLNEASIKGIARDFLKEFIYAGRLTGLQAAVTRRKATGILDSAFRKSVHSQLRLLKAEGLAWWARHCTCPSQKPAFLERYSGIEKALRK